MKDHLKEPSFEGMLQVFRLVMDGMKFFCKKFDLTISEASIILALCSHGELTLKELCEYIDFPKSTASRLVDGLVARKMVDRKVPPENRRTIKISVNKRFLKKLEDTNQGPELNKALTKNFSQKDGMTLIKDFSESMGKDARTAQMKKKK
ncbi:MAG: MarR family transcriptional regulator [Lachnospiraceae bacterium]|nr:MarR family transcriptional regulator [Lachnospiraceae bacterium]